ncbi:futalosine hydrolase [Paenibacillus ginsengarvi]|uniref:Futalosine hydrolase n=1 Tax=Paenibacillus ginsengarvi TaxID=400777 RepID=A0A3B0BCM8_9BACL|nr:futalosine hydrolase [Paenibacillus ginsengarvi]
MGNIQVKKVLVMTAVEVERAAVLRGLGGDGRFEVRLADVGPASAAANTALALAVGDYDLVISAGIGGGFAEVAGIGSLVLASEMIAADLGAESAEGFISVDELGFGSARIPADHAIAASWCEALLAAGQRACVGPVLTVCTATGSAASASALAARVKGAAAEGMEGFGVATAAKLRNVPALEIRAISNAVGPRDRAAWRIPEALQSLEKAFSVLTEVLS